MSQWNAAEFQARLDDLGRRLDDATARNDQRCSERGNLEARPLLSDLAVVGAAVAAIIIVTLFGMPAAVAAVVKIGATAAVAAIAS